MGEDAVGVWFRVDLAPIVASVGVTELRAPVPLSPSPPPLKPLPRTTLYSTLHIGEESEGHFHA